MGNSMGKKSKIMKVNPKWLRREALHTTHVVLSSLHDHLIEDGYFHSEINPKFNKHIEAALEHLNEAYQAVGDTSNEVKSKTKVQTY